MNRFKITNINDSLSWTNKKYFVITYIVNIVALFQDNPKTLSPKIRIASQCVIKVLNGTVKLKSLFWSALGFAYVRSSYDVVQWPPYHSLVRTWELMPCAVLWCNRTNSRRSTLLRATCLPRLANTCLWLFWIVRLLLFLYCFVMVCDCTLHLFNISYVEKCFSFYRK